MALFWPAKGATDRFYYLIDLRDELFATSKIDVGFRMLET
jgi:hypothetical protein